MEIKTAIENKISEEFKKKYAEFSSKHPDYFKFRFMSPSDAMSMNKFEITDKFLMQFMAIYKDVRYTKNYTTLLTLFETVNLQIKVLFITSIYHIQMVFLWKDITVLMKS